MTDVVARGATSRLWSPGDELGGAWLDAINSRTERAVPVAERLLRAALTCGDRETAVRAQHVLALAYLAAGRWRMAERHIDRMLDQLSHKPDPEFEAHAWVMRAACHAEREQADYAVESLVHAELAAAAAAAPSDQLALAYGDMAIVLSEMSLYEYAERMLKRALETATAAGAPTAMYLFKQGRNLARWAMRLEHQGRSEQALERYRESADALQVARDAEPDPRFSLESWMMTSVTTLCRGRAALISGEGWRPPKTEMASSRWMIKSSHSHEDAQWRVHAAASIALVTGEPRHALALLEGLRERDYAVRGPRLADRWHLFVLAYEHVGDGAAALRAHRKLHSWYDEASYRTRPSRVDAAKLTVQGGNGVTAAPSKSRASDAVSPPASAQAWISRAAGAAERGDSDAALESLVRAEQTAEAAPAPSEELALAFSDMAAMLSGLTQYEQAEQMLVRAIDAATAAGAPLGYHLSKRVGNLTRWAMRLEHLGRGEQAVHRYQESVAALLASGPELSVMSSMNTLAQARAALLSCEAWQPAREPAPAPASAGNRPEDVLWAVHAAASVALAADRPTDALTLLADCDEQRTDAAGFLLADGFYLNLLAHAKLGRFAEALAASRRLHSLYDADAYRSRRERVEAARNRVAESLSAQSVPAGHVLA